MSMRGVHRESKEQEEEDKMRIFITGATGFVGSAVVQELIKGGHQVVGLARSEQAAASLTAAGASVHRGSLEDVQSLRSGATASDGVIHTAFIHDFLNYGPAASADERAIETLGSVLAGSDRPLIVTSGTLAATPGRIAREEDRPNPDFPRKSEKASLALAERGVRAAVVRLPPTVHGEGDHGFIPALIAVARERGFSAYVGDGLNRWPAVHRSDAASLYRLAFEKASAGATYHGVADEGIPARDISAVIGRRLNLPSFGISAEEAGNHFGWIGRFFAMDGPASSENTQNWLGWRPTHPSLISDLEGPHYFETKSSAALLHR